jgi:Rrf2 family iron-sulfur cluster assembly transcriptional regulator
MLAVALHQGNGPLMTKEIADKNGLPPTYLEQLMVLLRKAGLLSSTRGAHGGYALNRPASEITLAEIIEVLEGPLVLADCPSGTGCCGNPEACALQDVWAEASQGLYKIFQNITLAQLVERQREKESSPMLMFSI